MRKPTKHIDETSWFYRTIKTTPAKLIKIATELDADFMDNNTGEDKVNFEFAFETGEGHYFTIYDWKINRPLNMDTTYEFHIGGPTNKATVKGKEALLKRLAKMG